MVVCHQLMAPRVHVFHFDVTRVWSSLLPRLLFTVAQSPPRSVLSIKNKHMCDDRPLAVVLRCID